MPGELSRTCTWRGLRAWNARYVIGLARDQSGTAAVEFAFVLMLLLSIFFGIVAFGFQFAARIALSYAVAEGGRSSVAGLTSAERQAKAVTAINRVLTSYSPLIDPTKAIVAATSQGQTPQGEAIELKIDYTDARFNLFPFLPVLSATARVKTVFLVSDPSG